MSRVQGWLQVKSLRRTTNKQTDLSLKMQRSPAVKSVVRYRVKPSCVWCVWRKVKRSSTNHNWCSHQTQTAAITAPQVCHIYTAFVLRQTRVEHEIHLLFDDQNDICQWVCESYSGLLPFHRSGWTQRWGRSDTARRWGWSGTRTCPDLWGGNTNNGSSWAMSIWMRCCKQKAAENQ